MEKGKVKWYNAARGFGFIESDNGEDIFVHRTGLDSAIKELKPDEEVVFETKQGEKGLTAINVKPAN
ncbi:MAG: cold shock domain-containing protein [Chlorobi bacterium]|nr:cold shock domain-containing protein [Chlorobiota bacterium]